MTRSLIVLLGCTLLSSCDNKVKKTDTGIISGDTAATADDTGTPDTGSADTDTDTDCEGEPTSGDSDGDGLPDAVEETSDHLNPYSADSDGDGVCDAAEDTDEDGLSNAEELVQGTDLNDLDSDGDDITDGAEIEHGLNPLDITDGDEDTDLDGLTNKQEIGIGGLDTDPNLPDTDGDHYPDGYEVNNGSDPNVTESWPVFDEILTCTDMTSDPGNHFFVDNDGDGEVDTNVRTYYGDDYRRGYDAYECVCTMSLGEAYARISDLVVFTPTSVHQNSPWEDSGKEQPIIGAVSVPYRSGPKTDGAFLLDKISQSKMEDKNKDVRQHWLAEPTDSVASSDVVNLEGDYTVYISVKNPEGSVIEDDDATYQRGCERLSGNDDESGYEGYLRLSLIPATYLTATSSSVLADTNESQTRFMLAVGLGGRLHMLSTGGSTDFASAPLTDIAIADWNGASRVHLRDQRGIIATLTPENHSVSLSTPLWLHQLEVVVDSASGTLPTLTATHVEHLQSPPKPPGQVFALTFQQLNTFLGAANPLFTMVDMLPEGTDQTMPTLQVRIEPPASDTAGPTWLRVDARGSGTLFSLPLAPVSDGQWAFDTTTDAFSANGSLSIGSGGDLSIQLGSGNFGSLQLQQSILSLEND